MKVHEFTIVASGLHPDTDDLVNVFFEAGCDDAALSFQKGMIILEFDREAASFSAAVVSAFDNVVNAGAKVERFEPDHLVSLTDIANRAGLSKAAITNYHKGDRAAHFPKPVARVTSESPLWDWCEVATWLHGRDKLGRDEMIQARIVKEANAVIDSHDIRPDHFIERMTERVRQLEEA